MLRFPLTACTVTSPVSVGGGGGGLELLPPQLAAAIKHPRRRANSTVHRAKAAIAGSGRNLAAGSLRSKKENNAPASMSPKPGHHRKPPNPTGPGGAALDAGAVTVRVAEPLMTTEEGFRLHDVDPRVEATLQVSPTMPVNPLAAVTDIVAVPEVP